MTFLFSHFILHYGYQLTTNFTLYNSIVAIFHNDPKTLPKSRYFRWNSVKCSIILSFDPTLPLMFLRQTRITRWFLPHIVDLIKIRGNDIFSKWARSWYPQYSIFRKSCQYPTNYIPFERARKTEQHLLRHSMAIYEN